MGQIPAMQCTNILQNKNKIDSLQRSEAQDDNYIDYGCQLLPSISFLPVFSGLPSSWGKAIVINSEMSS
jgi:hypothetical protein